jgi:hypothetical protein
MISRSLWVIRITVTAASRKDAQDVEQLVGLLRVSTALGSSRIRMRAPRYSTFTISTRCCSPTGRSPTSASGSTLQRVFAPEPLDSARAGPRLCFSSLSALGAPEHDVLQHREGVHLHEVLMHHARRRPLSASRGLCHHDS